MHGRTRGRHSPLFCVPASSGFCQHLPPSPSALGRPGRGNMRVGGRALNLMAVCSLPHPHGDSTVRPDPAAGAQHAGLPGGLAPARFQLVGGSRMHCRLPARRWALLARACVTSRSTGACACQRPFPCFALSLGEGSRGSTCTPWGAVRRPGHLSRSFLLESFRRSLVCLVAFLVNTQLGSIEVGLESSKLGAQANTFAPGSPAPGPDSAEPWADLARVLPNLALRRPRPSSGWIRPTLAGVRPHVGPTEFELGSATPGLDSNKIRSGSTTSSLYA